MQDPLNQDFLWARHSLIAKHLIEIAAKKTELAEAYKRLLSALSHDFSRTTPKKSPAFRLYQLLINHQKMYQRFGASGFLAKEIFEDVRANFSDDWQFWLQYGSLEMEYGDLSLAENYFDQASALNPNADFVIHARAHLWFKQALHTTSLTEAVMLREQAESSLLDQIAKEELDDPYPYHILCSMLLQWIKMWVSNKDKRREELKLLQKYIAEGIEIYPYEDKLKELSSDIKREYLSLATS